MAPPLVSLLQADEIRSADWNRCALPYLLPDDRDGADTAQSSQPLFRPKPLKSKGLGIDDGRNFAASRSGRAAWATSVPEAPMPTRDVYPATAGSSKYRLRESSRSSSTAWICPLVGLVT